MLLAEGTFECLIQSATYGADDRGVVKVRINAKFTDGPNAGRTTTYEDEVNAKSALYVGRSAKAVGWKGRDLNTIAADCDAWIKATGGKSAAEIRHIEIKKGKKFDEWISKGAKPADKPIWDKCICFGSGAKPLVAPTTEALNDANEAMRRAMAEDGGAPASAAKPDDDIPFISSAFADEPSVIARVLRGAL